MAGKNRGKLGIGLPDPDLSKNRGGLPDLDPIFVEILSPSRYLAHGCSLVTVEAKTAIKPIRRAKYSLFEQFFGWRNFWLLFSIYWRNFIKIIWSH